MCIERCVELRLLGPAETSTPTARIKNALRRIQAKSYPRDRKTQIGEDNICSTKQHKIIVCFLIQINDYSNLYIFKKQITRNSFLLPLLQYFALWYMHHLPAPTFSSQDHEFTHFYCDNVMGLFVSVMGRLIKADSRRSCDLSSKATIVIDRGW